MNHILGFYAQAKMVLRQRECLLEQVSLMFVRSYIRMIGILPRKWSEEHGYYSLAYALLIAMGSMFIATVACDLYEARQNLTLLGDDIVVIIGGSLIMLKIYFHGQHSSEIHPIVDKLNGLHKMFAEYNGRSRLKIKRLQCSFYLFEVFAFSFYIFLIVLFATAVMVPPLLTHHGLPYRAHFPILRWENSDQHPIGFAIAYIFQVFWTCHALLSIVCMDNLACGIFLQTALNLKILCIRFREISAQNVEERESLDELKSLIKIHQYIINLIENINACYYLNYVAQMGASTFMICLTAFEALLAQDRPMIAIKFEIYMLSAFLQLLYWCCAGNLVFFESLNVADAAYEIPLWYTRSKEFKMTVAFLIRRAQKPLQFRPSPLYGFNIKTFTSILSTSYSYFALLCTMNK
uniref:Odorant receptor n=1 Tax=Glossina austeni TaxID=7395 RepID=A0A1A9UV33_GLOAU